MVRESAFGDQVLCGLVDVEVEAREDVFRNFEELARGTCLASWILAPFRNPNALGNARKMGRSIKAGADAGCDQNAGERRRGAALAIGSSDEDGRELPLRIAQRVRQHPHVRDVELAAGSGGRQLLGEPVQMVDRCDVGHKPYSRAFRDRALLPDTVPRVLLFRYSPSHSIESGMVPRDEMDKREFMKGSAVTAAAMMMQGFTTRSAAADDAVPRTNWAGNYHYSTNKVLQPASLAEAQDAVRSVTGVRALGTRHSFNGIADSQIAQISTLQLKDVHLDPNGHSVTVGAGIRYGDLAVQLD